MVDNNPTVRRRRLGSGLRRLRAEAGLSLEDVAGKLECSAAKISRIENGRNGVRPADLRALLSLYGVTDERRVEAMLTLARDVRRRGWWSRYGSILDRSFADFVAIEAAAVRVRCYEPLFVPGLLQTRAYARALFAVAGEPEECVEDFLLVRIGRQRRLRDGRFRLSAVVGEGALLHEVAGPAVRREQLLVLAEAAMSAHVELRVLPLRSPVYACSVGAFSVLTLDGTEPDVVYQDTVSGTVFVDAEDEVARLTATYERIRAASLVPEESAALLRDMAGRA